MIFATTGHRPDKLGGYDPLAWGKTCGYASVVMRRYRPSKMIIGMALGWDMAVACACVAMNIPFIAAVPFRGQERLWHPSKIKLYRMLLAQSEEMHVISGGEYEAWKMLRRNAWMVDRCGALIALYDGESTGGTYRCVEYAKSKGKPVHNVWEGWVACAP